MTTEDINRQLYRPIQSGSQFDKYFPNSSCTNTPLATGNTKVAIDNMAKWAKKYADHCKDIAPVLDGDDIETTVNNIQDFLYNHFQYTIDGELQNLKSPACAWSTRAEGMDCKSYSIFASCILLKLGIKHYLRRIKQEVMADAYTHVYVVIPENQDTAKLKDGYFIIDGTIQYNDELPFTAKDDIFMNYEPKLAIHGLAAPGLGCGGDCGCGGQQNPIALMGGMSLAAYYQDLGLASPVPNDNGGPNAQTSSNFFTQIQTALTCINSTFTPKQVASQVNGVHIPHVDNLINAVYAANSPQGITTALNALEKFMANANQFFWDERVIGNNWEKCSRQALDIYTEYYRAEYPKIENIVANDLRQFFNVTSVSKNATTTIPTIYDKQSGPAGQPMTYKQYTVAGDPTAWLQSGSASGGFTGSVPTNGGIDLDDVLDYIPGYGNGGGINPNDGIYYNENGVPLQNGGNTQLAGFGLVPMLLIGGVVAGAIYMNSKKGKK